MPETISRRTVAQYGSTGSHALIQDSMPLVLTMEPKPILSEDANGNKIHVIKLGGRFQFAGRPNANGRIYPIEVLRNAVEEIQEDVKARRIMGEFDHPPDAKIHLDRVSHLLSRLWMEGDEVFGEIEILSKTTHGGQLQALIDSGVSVGISSRGVGDMETTMFENDEYYQVLPGYTFVTFDVVAEPSVKGSYLTVSESRNRVLGNRVGNIRKKREDDILHEVKNLLYRR